jgi:hypothetical protein
VSDGNIAVAVNTEAVWTVVVAVAVVVNIIGSREKMIRETERGRSAGYILASGYKTR